MRPSLYNPFDMRIVTNEPRVKRESILAKVGIYGSLAVLMGGLALTLFGQQWGLLSAQNIIQFYVIYAGILLVGLLISRFGMFYGNRHLSPQRPELQLKDNLKGLDRKFTLMLFKEPHDYILIEPGGVSAFICKNQQGAVSFKNGKWKNSQGIISRIIGRNEPLGDPKKDSDEVLTSISTMLKAKLPSYQIPLRSIVVFCSPQVRLNVDPTPYAVLKPDGLKDYLRGAGKWKELPASVQRALRDALGAPADQPA